MRQFAFAAAALPFLATALSANVNQIPSDTPALMLPQDGDDFSRLAAQAASQDKATDFRALRFAWLDSKARERHGETTLRPEVNAMFDAAGAGNNRAVREKAVALLSAEYVSIVGQMYLLVSCTELGDQACAAQAKFAARGLTQSIPTTGDGKTCETGWEVAMVEEEYAILRIMHATPKQQALIGGKNGGHSCDAMTVTDKDSKELTYYFTIDRVLADEAKMLGFRKP